jgi:hypothetical protein
MRIQSEISCLVEVCRRIAFAQFLALVEGVLVLLLLQQLKALVRVLCPNLRVLSRVHWRDILRALQNQLPPLVMIHLRLFSQLANKLSILSISFKLKLKELAWNVLVLCGILQR